jgi:hypothetical protein
MYFYFHFKVIIGATRLHESVDGREQNRMWYK